MAEIPEINKKKCTGCGLCVGVCSCKALVMVDNVVAFVKKAKCTKCTRWCAQCEIVCPVEAIACPFEIVIEER